MFKTTLSQTIFILKRKEAVCTFCLLFLMISVNFISNVLYFQGTDIVEMYHPMKLLLLSYNRTNFNATNTLLLVQLYPLLVVCPAGFSLLREQQLGIKIFAVSRLGAFQYHISKFISAFLATTIIFTLPFLLEIILNCTSFPLSASGDLYNLSFYDSFYRDSINHYFMKNLYLFSPYIYAVAGTLLFGIVSGLFATFTLAFSSLVKIKYRIFLFLPVFMILNLLTIGNNQLPKGSPSMNWYDYMLLFNDEAKNTGCWLLILFALVLFLIIAVCISSRKDCLS